MGMDMGTGMRLHYDHTEPSVNQFDWWHVRREEREEREREQEQEHEYEYGSGSNDTYNSTSSMHGSRNIRAVPPTSTSLEQEAEYAYTRWT
jgi:hypothetical protein